MKVLFYSATKNGAGKTAQSVVEDRVPKKDLEVYRSIESFSNRFRQFSGDVAAAVLVAESTESLLDLFSIRDLFTDIRIILILPDRQDETVSLGFKLFPRFISYADGNFEDVGAVLQKMVAYMKSNYSEYCFENEIIQLN